jgi:hypothetical protein
MKNIERSLRNNELSKLRGVQYAWDTTWAARVEREIARRARKRKSKRYAGHEAHEGKN